MPNIAGVLREEIRRLAKKEVKSQISKTRKATAQYRRDIITLKQQMKQQEREIELLKRQRQQPEMGEEVSEELLKNARFSARSVKAQRYRLGLSAADYGKLVGVSSLTIFHWEHGTTYPRKAQLAALIAVRGIGKREALKKLAKLTPEKGEND
jgi:DNA-binding transcriptional regulator YiaG